MKKVEVSIDINSSPSTIIHAFTDDHALKQWWGVERALIEARVGGTYLLAWNISDQGFGYVSAGIISGYHPASKLEISNYVYLNPQRPILDAMQLNIAVTEKGGGSELYLCQSGYQEGDDWEWYYNAVKGAWPAVLAGLKEYLERA